MPDVGMQLDAALAGWAGEGGDLTRQQDGEARRLAVQLASQLPENVQVARQSIRYLAALQDRFLEGLSRPDPAPFPKP